MERFIYSLMIFSVLTLIIGCDRKLPEEAKQSFSSSNTFTNGILLPVPTPDKNSRYENIINNPMIVDNSFIPQVSVSVNESKSTLEYDKYLLSFLINNKYLEIKSAQQTTVNRFGQETQKFNFAIYTSLGENLLTMSNDPNSKYNIKVGTRVIKTITNETSTKQDINGTSVRVYPSKFTYTIEPIVQGFDDLKNKVFNGEVQIFKDPSTNNWSFNNIILSDRNQNEFLDLVHSSYQPYMTAEEIKSSRVDKVRARYPCLNINSQFIDDTHFIGYFAPTYTGAVYTLNMTYVEATGELTVDNSNNEPFDCNNAARFVISVN